MIEAEHIRVAGVAVAALFAAYGVLRYRRGGSSRLDLLVALAIALGIALVSVVPHVIGGFFTRLLGLEDRGFALVSIAVLLLFGLFTWLLGKVRQNARRNGEIVTGLAVRDYEEKFLTPRERVEGHPGEVLIIVPAYNEEGGIGGVLGRIPETVLGHPVKTVVVDDGSTDATAAVAREAGVPVVTHVVNRGQGDALRTGFAIAVKEAAEVVVNLDADGQYKPEELDRLVGPILDGKADFVLGSRFMGFYEEAGSVRHIGVVFFSKMISLLTGVKVSDCTNGYRAIRVSEVPKMDLREDRFNANEITLECLKNKMRFHQVPISMMSRAAGETKKPPKLAYPLGVFRVIISTWLR